MEKCVAKKFSHSEIYPWPPQGSRNVWKNPFKFRYCLGKCRLKILCLNIVLVSIRFKICKNIVTTYPTVLRYFPDWLGTNKILEAFYNNNLDSNDFYQLFIWCMLREKFPNTEFFLVHMFPYSDWMQRSTS